jgi:hypothetical protein
MRMSGLLLIGVVTVLSARAASADVYHGVLCNASGSDVTSISRIRSGVFNSSTTAVKRVHCGGATSGGPISSVSTTVFDRSPSDDVDCTLFISSLSGVTRFTANAHTSGFSSASMIVTFTNIPPVDGMVVLQCVIPADDAQNGASFVSSYSINEGP